LLLHGLLDPLPLEQVSGEFPPAAQWIRLARQRREVHLDIEYPESWDMPMWIASGRIDSMGLATSRLGPEGPVGPRLWGKPRDMTLYPEPHGAARWSEEIYFKLLDCGLRIPPSASSGSGTMNNPVGYNRVYVHVDGEITFPKWWEALRRGRVVVTNGPLLRPNVRGQPPGHVFHGNVGHTISLRIDLRLAVRDPVEYLEIIKNGRVEHVVRLDDYAAAGGQLPELTFSHSGWFLVRAVSLHSKSYRFGCTGPYYVEIGGQPRISRADAEFFLDWVYARARQLAVEDPVKRRAVLKYHRAARDFWQQLAARATAQ
jgi:hypothetical protein